MEKEAEASFCHYMALKLYGQRGWEWMKGMQEEEEDMYTRETGAKYILYIYYIHDVHKES